MAKSKKRNPTTGEAAATPRLPDSSEASAPWTTRLARNADLQTVLAFAALFAVAYFTYRESLSGRLFFDDTSAIEHNGHVFALVDPATRWNWQAWYSATTAPQDTPFAGRPIISLSFALNHWWASEMRPSGMEGFTGVLPIHYPYFHYVNLALHMLVAAALYALVRRTLLSPSLGDRFRSTASLWAFALALVWVVHPLNTETVVYVTQRTEQIVSLFLLLTLICGSRALDAASARGRLVCQAAAVTACALGMASKENMIAAPLLVVAYDRAFRFDSWRSAFRARAGYYACLAATWLILLAVMWTVPRGRSVGFDHAQWPWFEYPITQCWCLWRYFWLSLVPLGGKLCVDYGRRPVLEFWHTAPGALLILSALGLTAWGWLRKPWIGFLGAWFFFILAPTSSFVPIVTEVGAERRMYLPLVAVLCGAGALLAAGVAALPRSTTKRNFPASNFRRRWQAAGVFGCALFAGLVLWLAHTSLERTKIYQHDLTLYGHIVEVFPDNDRGRNNFAKILIERGYLDSALEHLNRAVAIDPQYSDAFSNSSIVFLKHPRNHRLDIAVADASEALVWNPRDLYALNNRGLAFFEAKLYEPALADFTRIIDLTAGRTEAHLSRAEIYLHRGEEDPRLYDAGLEDIQRGIDHYFYSYRAYLIRASILNKQRRPEAALAALKSSLDNFRREASQLGHNPALAPSLSAAESVLTQINALHRQPPPAVQETLQKFPYRSILAHILNERAEAHRVRGELRILPREIEASLDDLCRVIVLEPNNPDHYCARGELYLAMKRYGEALLDYNQALTLQPDWAAALRGRVATALKLRDFDTAWADARHLRDLGVPLDEPTLASLRQLSGRDYPN